MTSGLPINNEVVIGGNSSIKLSFDAISKSGKIVNAYNAFILASRMTR